MQREKVKEEWNRMAEDETAYDVEKVVEELKKQAEQYRHRAFEVEKKGLSILADKYYGKQCSYEHAIEIVKNGGVSDDVCEWKSDCHLENDNPAEWLICPHKPKRIFSKDIKYCPYCGKKIKVVE